MNDYWVVIENKTGRIIAHCGEEKDALLMILLCPGRTYRKEKFLMDNVINVNFSKAKELPGQLGLTAAKHKLSFEEEFNRLPEGQGIPVDTK